jgi:hypothetical protein
LAPLFYIMELRKKKSILKLIMISVQLYNETAQKDNHARPIHADDTRNN